MAIATSKNIFPTPEADLDMFRGTGAPHEDRDELLQHDEKSLK